jgi:DNA-binding transcriptional MerR regulator
LHTSIGARSFGSVSAESRAEAFVEAHHERGGEVFGIAELAAELGVTPRAIRFYESKGLLAPRRVNGSRIYTRRDRARLILILRAKSIGSSLAEIEHYLDLYGEQGEGRVQQLEYVIGRTTETIRDLEAKRRSIDETLEELRLIRESCQAHLAERRRDG